MAESKKINSTGYSLTKSWFNFAYDNPDKVNHAQTALFCWLVELCNRKGFPEKFPFNTDDACSYVGVSNRKTIWKALNELFELGFIDIVYKSDHRHKPSILSFSNCIGFLENTENNLSKIRTSKEIEPVQNSDRYGNGKGTSTETVSGHSLKLNKPSKLDKQINIQSFIHPDRAREFDEAIDGYFESQKKEEEKSSAKKEEDVPTAAEADQFFTKHYTSFYDLISKDNIKASTPELRLGMLERFWEENVDNYRVKMPPWGDVVKHFRNWVPQYVLVLKGREQQEQKNKNQSNGRQNTKINIAERADGRNAGAAAAVERLARKLGNGNNS